MSDRDHQSVAERLEKAEWVLRAAGFRECDCMACNCGSWHQVGGFKLRFDEIKEVVEEAGYSTNGRTLLKAVTKLADDRNAMLGALKGVVAVADRKTDEFDRARAAIAKAEGI